MSVQRTNEYTGQLQIVMRGLGYVRCVLLPLFERKKFFLYMLRTIYSNPLGLIRTTLIVSNKH